MSVEDIRVVELACIWEGRNGNVNNGDNNKNNDPNNRSDSLNCGGSCNGGGCSGGCEGGWLWRRLLILILDFTNIILDIKHSPDFVLLKYAW